MFPAHVDLQPIIKRIREKFDLPDLASFDKNLSNILLLEEEIPWNEIQDEIKSEIENASEFFPESLQPVRRMLHSDPNALDNPEKIMEILLITPEDIQAASTVMLHVLKPLA